MKRPIRKTILVDESMQPVAVQIGYADWLELERVLGLPSSVPPGEAGGANDLNRFAGKIKLREDPLDYQRRVRDEWNR